MTYHEPTRDFDGQRLLHLRGVGRDAENRRSLVLYFNREPTDDEMRAVHEALLPIVNNNSRGIVQ